MEIAEAKKLLNDLTSNGGRTIEAGINLPVGKSYSINVKDFDVKKTNPKTVTEGDGKKEVFYALPMVQGEVTKPGEIEPLDKGFTWYMVDNTAYWGSMVKGETYTFDVVERDYTKADGTVGKRKYAANWR